MMTSIANLSSVPPTPPALNIHPHGRKKGPHAQTLDETGGGAAPTPARTTQSLFGRLLQSLEKLIGAKLGVAASAATSTASTGASADTAAAAATHISVKA